jgi:hypothetical protein
LQAQGRGVAGIAEYARGKVYQDSVNILTGAPAAACNTVNANIVTVGMSVHL